MGSRGKSVKVASTGKVVPAITSLHVASHTTVHVTDEGRDDAVGELVDRSFLGPIRKGGVKGAHQFNPKISAQQGQKVAKKDPRPSLGVTSELGRSVLTLGNGQIDATVGDVPHEQNIGSDFVKLVQEVPTHV
ncbi:hypothetical protein V6N13_092968 [Hibiscus sabdariffa]